MTDGLVLGTGGVVHVVPPEPPPLRMSPPTSPPVTVVPVIGPRGPKGDPGDAEHFTLSALLDVDAEPDRRGVLERQSDGIVRPVPIAHQHTQDIPSTVWLIGHELPFAPAGIDVRDHNGDRHYPQVSHPDEHTVRLDFGADTRGTARLS